MLSTLRMKKIYLFDTCRYKICMRAAWVSLYCDRGEVWGVSHFWSVCSFCVKGLRNLRIQQSWFVRHNVSSIRRIPRWAVLLVREHSQTYANKIIAPCHLNLWTPFRFGMLHGVRSKKKRTASQRRNEPERDHHILYQAQKKLGSTYVIII